MIRTNLANRRAEERSANLIAKEARVSNSALFNGCRIYGTVLNSILYPGVEVGSNAIVKDSIIMPDTEICDDSLVHNAIVDADVRIGFQCALGASSSERVPEDLEAQEKLIVIGQYSELDDDSKIIPGMRIEPPLETA